MSVCVCVSMSVCVCVCVPFPLCLHTSNIPFHTCSSIYLNLPSLHTCNNMYVNVWNSTPEKTWSNNNEYEHQLDLPIIFYLKPEPSRKKKNTVIRKDIALQT